MPRPKGSKNKIKATNVLIGEGVDLVIVPPKLEVVSEPLSKPIEESKPVKPPKEPKNVPKEPKEKVPKKITIKRNPDINPSPSSLQKMEKLKEKRTKCIQKYREKWSKSREKKPKEKQTRKKRESIA